MPSSYRGARMLEVLNLPPITRKNFAKSPDLVRACTKVGVINFVPKHPLGSGGFSNVYEVDENRVVKIFNQNVSDEMLLREIKMIRYPKNEFIINTIGCVATQLGNGVVLERGELELFDYIIDFGGGQGRGIDALTVENFFVDLIEGICFLHSEGIYHCDLKPENIMFTKGQLKICDFGLSHCALWKDSKQNPIGSLASPGRVFGTEAYMPPQSIAHSIRFLRDEWALGVILFGMAYQMLLSDNIYLLERDNPILLTATHKNKHAGTAKEYEKNYSDICGCHPRPDVEYYLKYLLREVPMEISELKKQITGPQTDIEFWLLSEPPPKRPKK